jgi:hypothetical protein
MTADPFDGPPLEERQAKLERALIDEYLIAAGERPDDVRRRADPAALDLLKAAAIYAAGRLTEVESRAHYVHDIHGT